MAGRYEYKVVELRERLLGGKMSGDKLEKVLNENPEGPLFRAYHGMKHQHPYLEDAVKEMAEDELTSAVGLVLAPHYSRFSVGEYIDRVEVMLPGWSD